MLGKAPDQEQLSIQRLFGKALGPVLVDRGHRSYAQVGASEVILPAGCRAKDNYAPLPLVMLSEPSIPTYYLHSLRRNYLKGTGGARLNALLAGIGFNLSFSLREIRFFVLSLQLLIKTARQRSQQIGAWEHQEALVRGD